MLVSTEHAEFGLVRFVRPITGLFGLVPPYREKK